MYGIPGYDDLLPDDSAASSGVARGGRTAEEAEDIKRGEAGPLTPADAVTLDCTTQAAAQEVTAVDLSAEHRHRHALLTGPAMFLGRGRADGPGEARRRRTT